MFKTGEMVVYGGAGLCKIAGIEEREAAGNVSACYVLVPEEATNTVIYVPKEGVVAQTRIRKVISGKELKEMISKSVPALWEENDRTRKKEYVRAINMADREAVFSFVKSCGQRIKELEEAGKKLRKVDEYFLQDAEKLLYSEFKSVFEIEKKDVIPFILGELEVSEL